MNRYRKLPTVIDAVQWTGDNIDEVKALAGNQAPFVIYHPAMPLVIHTREGDMTASFGDWIIRGLEGELYPCSDSVFQMTYEGVEE